MKQLFAAIFSAYVFLVPMSASAADWRLFFDGNPVLVDGPPREHKLYLFPAGTFETDLPTNGTWRFQDDGFCLTQDNTEACYTIREEPAGWFIWSGEKIVARWFPGTTSSSVPTSRSVPSSTSIPTSR